MKLNFAIEVLLPDRTGKDVEAVAKTDEYPTRFWTVVESGGTPHMQQVHEMPARWRRVIERLEQVIPHPIAVRGDVTIWFMLCALNAALNGSQKKIISPVSKMGISRQQRDERMRVAAEKRKHRLRKNKGGG